MYFFTKKVKNFFILIILGFVLLSCRNLTSPYGLDFNKPPPGPPEYQQGWKDGCEAGVYTYSKTFYQYSGMYEVRYDPRYANSRMYSQVWKDAWLFCSFVGDTFAGDVL